MDKDKLITLYTDTVEEISTDFDKWKDFLRTASRFYDRDFEEQVLIYAQRSDATFCGYMREWNDKMNCYINRGSHGIALFPKNGSNKIRYIFDIKDVNPAKNIGKLPYIWKVDNNQTLAAAVEHLEKQISVKEENRHPSSSSENLRRQLFARLSSVLLQTIKDNLEDFYAHAAETMMPFSKKDEFSVEAFLFDGLCYLVFDRLNISQFLMMSPEPVSEGFRFFAHEKDDIAFISKTLSEWATPILDDIRHTVLVERYKAQNQAQSQTNDMQVTQTEKEPKKVLANLSESDYNAVAKGIDKDVLAVESLDERSDTHEKTGVLLGRGLSVSRLRGRGRGGDEGEQGDGENRGKRGDGASTRQVWGAEDAVSQGKSSAGVSGVTKERGTLSTLSNHRKPSTRGSDVSDGRDGKERGRDGGTKKKRPIRLGRGNEQHQIPSGGNSAKRDGVHLEQEEKKASDNEKILSGAILMSEKKKEDVLPSDEIDKIKETKEKIKAPTVSAQNFHITETPADRSKTQRCQDNIAAIRLLKDLEKLGENATLEQQEVLNRYVGWGGIPEVFDSESTAMRKEYNELQSLLTEKEYTSARVSTLNAHYTSPEIIDAMYKTLAQLGFTSGNILEPSLGIGNFLGMLPESMQDSQIYGTELDSVSGRIAQKLYPNATIAVEGFEKSNYSNDFFDVAIGNVPFGNYSLSDKQYDRHNFLIHDYFFAKSLDKVRPGGIVAFITSKGTMDKADNRVRKYLAQRAELLGAIRLPNTAFKQNAGTEVTSDILFLKKANRILDEVPEWVYTGTDENDIAMNLYFIHHPEMICGTMSMVSGRFGQESACLPNTETPLSEQLSNAILHISGQIDRVTQSENIASDLAQEVVPADLTVRDFSYTVIDDTVYFRKNSIMEPHDFSNTATERIKGLIEIRNCVYNLLDAQLENGSDTEIEQLQKQLNNLYDAYVKKYDRITTKANRSAFSEDDSYPLLASLEDLDEEGKFLKKADIFNKRTIKKSVSITHVDTASEALAVSLAERAKVDLEFMSQLSDKDAQTLTRELSSVVFKNPQTEAWETGDSYLSGNVREKLKIAQNAAKESPEEYAGNVTALEEVMPKDLDASEIDVRLGATWINPDYIKQFMKDVLKTPPHMFYHYGYAAESEIDVTFAEISGAWHIDGKNKDRGNPLVVSTYGTEYRNAYEILEDSLNLKDSRVYDTDPVTKQRILNQKETTLAAQKQEVLKAAFTDWIFKDPQRRQDLVKTYNERFNSVRPREFDGAHLTFPGMTPNITLKDYQKNAVAHVLYGKNTLLAHCVGAGKTFEMATAAMELKRLGLCQKSLFVVPNHLTEQWATDFLRLYPAANILAARKKDFEPINRKKFCSRIALGNYDAVIIGHSQFEKIPLSAERQKKTIQAQIDEIMDVIDELKRQRGSRFTIKEIEKRRKQLEKDFAKLNDLKKDDVVTFEQLGVDHLFVDESHYYKNLFLYTKMQNVAGISGTQAKKSSDMFAKCRYLDELTGGRGITFATGTPISNSMTELYTNMRYLQFDTLETMGLSSFDAWASTFGETQTALELAPEGTGYKVKTRFSRFFNLPELMSVFKESADIKTADMLNLPVPKVKRENVVIKPSEHQEMMVKGFAERAEIVRHRGVSPDIDNMLKITTDGRKLALDQRIIDDVLPDEKNSKVNICVDNAFKIWESTKEEKSTQLIFCDLSTPKGDKSFNVYDDVKKKLVLRGVPENEIAFIHSANSDKQKDELFAKVRSGQIRFLLGSTQKMGAGTNVQNRLIALHHLDVPWRPSDIEQQEGRIIRQGNQNDTVIIYRYVTEGTFDAYSWQVIENKQKFISQIMTSKQPVRSCEDVDEAALDYAEIKALATGNPYIKEKMELDIEVSKLKMMRANYQSQQYRLEDDISVTFPKQIAIIEERIQGFSADQEVIQKNFDKKNFSMIVGDKTYTDKKEAGTALLNACYKVISSGCVSKVGKYAGFILTCAYDYLEKVLVLTIKGSIRHQVSMGTDAIGNITRLNNALEGVEKELSNEKIHLADVEQQLASAKEEVSKPFPKEKEFIEKSARLAELNALLSLDAPDAEQTEKKVQSYTEQAEKQTEENHEMVAEKPQGFGIQPQEPKPQKAEKKLAGQSVEENHFHKR